MYPSPFPPPTIVNHRSCFEKSLVRSLFYMVRDMACLMGLQYIYPRHVAGSWPLTIVWWNAKGFMLWALFVVGEIFGALNPSPRGLSPSSAGLVVRL